MVTALWIEVRQKHEPRNKQKAMWSFKSDFAFYPLEILKLLIQFGSLCSSNLLAHDLKHSNNQRNKQIKSAQLLLLDHGLSHLLNLRLSTYGPLTCKTDEVLHIDTSHYDSILWILLLTTFDVSFSTIFFWLPQLAQSSSFQTCPCFPQTVYWGLC